MTSDAGPLVHLVSRVVRTCKHSLTWPPQLEGAAYGAPFRRLGTLVIAVDRFGVKQSSAYVSSTKRLSQEDVEGTS
jgi:hypothetical protein